MRPSPPSLSIALLLFVGAVATGASADTRAESAKIEFKAAGPADYWIRTIERSQRDSFLTTPEKGADDWHTVDTLELVRQSSRAGEPGFLEVTVEPLGKSVRINSHKVDVPDDRTPFGYRVTLRGEMPDAKAMGDIAAAIVPSFPAEAVPVGHKWTVKVPPTESFPHPYEVTHRLDRIEAYQGEPAAHVVTDGQLITKDADLAFNLTVTGMMRVGLTSGVILKAQTVTVFGIQAVKRFKEGHKIIRRQIQRTVERRVPGAAGGPR